MFCWERNALFAVWKYSASPTRTIRMLTSRTRTSPLNSRLPRPRSCVPVPDASRAVVSLTFPPLAFLEGLYLRRRLHDLLHFGVPFEARRGLEVTIHRLWRDEDEACVGLGRPC